MGLLAELAIKVRRKDSFVSLWDKWVFLYVRQEKYSECFTYRKLKGKSKEA